MNVVAVRVSSGHLALVDRSDLELVEQYRWHLNRRSSYPYAQAHYFKADGTRSTVTMHRLIMGWPPAQIDHRNGEGLDNRRANLRLATQSQNSANTRPKSRTGYKGVSRQGRYWQAEGRSNGARYYLGLFKTVEEAARAYDAWALAHQGEFARPNFPIPDRAPQTAPVTAGASA